MHFSKRLTTLACLFVSTIFTSPSLHEHRIVDRFIEQNNLPPYSNLSVNKNNQVTLLWESPAAPG